MKKWSQTLYPTFLSTLYFLSSSFRTSSPFLDFGSPCIQNICLSCKGQFIYNIFIAYSSSLAWICDSFTRHYDRHDKVSRFEWDAKFRQLKLQRDEYNSKVFEYSACVHFPSFHRYFFANPPSSVGSTCPSNKTRAIRKQYRWKRKEILSQPGKLPRKTKVKANNVQIEWPIHWCKLYPLNIYRLRRWKWDKGGEAHPDQ